MKKLLIAAIVLAGIAVLARLFGPKVSNIDWEKRLESMPDDAPPKWMFRNISEIHDNTERILEILEPRERGVDLTERSTSAASDLTTGAPPST